eukprot:1449658-Rhodomonas_salina.1
MVVSAAARLPLAVPERPDDSHCCCGLEKGKGRIRFRLGTLGGTYLRLRDQILALQMEERAWEVHSRFTAPAASQCCVAPLRNASPASVTSV